MFYLGAFVMRIVCCAGEVGSSPAWLPAGKLPPGACRDCGMRLMRVWVETGDSKSLRRAAVNSLWEEGVCPHVPTLRSLLGVNLCVFASVRQLMPSLPITRKRTALELISCLRAEGKLFLYTQQRRLEFEAEPDYSL